MSKVLNIFFECEHFFCLPPPKIETCQNQIKSAHVLYYGSQGWIGLRELWMTVSAILSFYIRQQNQNYIPYYGPGTEKELRTENFARFYLEKYLHRKGFLEWIMYCLCQN